MTSKNKPAAVQSTSTEFDPFGNDSQSKSVGPAGGLTFENGTDAINVYGDLTIKADSKPEDLDNLIETLQTIRKKLKP